MKNQNVSRLKNLIQIDDLGIPNSVVEMLKKDLQQLFGEYLDVVGEGVEMTINKSGGVCEITVSIKATGTKSIQLF